MDHLRKTYKRERERERERGREGESERLIKRLKIVGLPNDIIELIKVRLKDRFFYVAIGENNSVLIEVVSGTIQGSILGPLLYAIYVSPLFDLTSISNFADDNFMLEWSLCRNSVRSNILIW